MPSVSNAPSGSWVNGKFVLPPILAAAVQAGGQPGVVAPGRPGGAIPVGRPGVSGPAGGNVVTKGPENNPAADPAEVPGIGKSQFHQVTDHNPSLSAAVSNGNIEDPSWYLSGGPDIMASTDRAVHKVAANLIGLEDPAFTLGRALGLGKKATDNIDEWGSIEDNSGAAKSYDYGSYVDNNSDLLDAYKTLPDRDPRGYGITLKSFDFNHNGVLEKPEFGQFHYQTSGKAEGRPITELTQPGRPKSSSAPASAPQGVMDVVGRPQLEQAAPAGAAPPQGLMDVLNAPALQQLFAGQGAQGPDQFTQLMQAMNQVQAGAQPAAPASMVTPTRQRTRYGDLVM